MTADAKATERPWRIDYLDKHDQRVISGPHYEVATIWHHSTFERTMEANAKLIVTAVNSYDPALQDKLTKAVKALDEVQDYIQRGGDLEELGKIVSAALRQIKESEHG